MKIVSAPLAFGALGLSLVIGAGGCPQPPDATIPAANPIDRTNGGARYVGATACASCHAEYAATHALHGHANTLTPVLDGAPDLPGPSAGVPDPPPGFTWDQISYVRGGDRKGALFLDLSGHILSTGVSGVPTQWNLAFPANGGPGEFVAFEPNADEPVAYSFDDIARETTGAQPATDDRPGAQDNRPGIRGTWSEPGVQCEACHGPGGSHFFTVDDTPRVDTSRIFVDLTGSQTCNACHSQPLGDQSGRIRAAGGFISGGQQYAELRASGGHSAFSCTTCHDPHRSLAEGREAAIRNDCTACHTDATMAGHAGKVFRRADGYEEALRCESCHMPFATRAFSNASEAIVGPVGRIGDTRSHVFRISTDPIDADALFSADGGELPRDDLGRAVISVDFACVRCHNGRELFMLSVSRAAEIARRVHELPED